jgi:RimJ/RimL family protein N-acetyltransferase
VTGDILLGVAGLLLELRTDRLLLRQWRDEDVEPLARIHDDPGYLEHMPYLDLAETREQVERIRRRWRDDGYSWWAAEDRETGTFLGRIGLACHHDWPVEEDPTEVGWTLGPEARGRGLATEGGRASVAAAFEHLDVDRVISITTPANTRSLRVMRKLGLTHRGGATWHGYDVVWYAVDRADWTG